MVAGKIFPLRASCKGSAVVQSLTTWAECAVGKGTSCVADVVLFSRRKKFKEGKYWRQSLRFRLPVQFLTECFSSTQNFQVRRTKLWKLLNWRLNNCWLDILKLCKFLMCWSGEDNKTNDLRSCTSVVSYNLWVFSIESYKRASESSCVI